MFSYLWYGVYENLVVSSVGLIRFNLLGSSSSSRAGMSSLGCVISFHRYLVLKLVISALTLRRLMAYIYIYGAPILDVSRSHTTTHHSR